MLVRLTEILRIEAYLRRRTVVPAKTAGGLGINIKRSFSLRYTAEAWPLECCEVGLLVARPIRIPEDLNGLECNENFCILMLPLRTSWLRTS